MPRNKYFKIHIYDIHTLKCVYECLIKLIIIKYANYYLFLYYFNSISYLAIFFSSYIHK